MPEQRQGQRRLVLDTVILGLAGAAAAQVFTLLLDLSRSLFLDRIAQYHPPGLPGEGGAAESVGRFGLWLIPLVTTLGGFLVGIITKRVAPEAEGHGTGAVVRAYHRAEGFLRARVPFVKIVASALTIGSGGSAGREGPVALVGAGIGSWYARFNNRSEEERRMLLLVGMAAGLSAIFRSPIGTALFAIEVLYYDMVFESAALLYATLAAIIAYAVNGFFVGYAPLFTVPATSALARPLDYGWYIVLGVAAGLVAILLPNVFYFVRNVFRRLPIDTSLKPALGGLLMGLLALIMPQVIGGGYGWMQAAIDGRLALWTMFALIFAKMLAMSLTVGSGGSGGVFAPSLFLGTMLGGFIATLVHQPTAPFAVVGMAAVFAGAARVPFATLMMVTEMTGGYTLLVPAALAVMVSYLVQSRLSGRFTYRSLYESQVRNRADSPAHHTEHLKVALRILREHGVARPADVGEFDLLSILRSGIPVDLPDHRHLVVGVLRKDSGYAGKALKDARFEADTIVTALMRGEHMLVPRGDTVLQAGDHLILVTSGEGLERLKHDIDPW